MNDVRKIFRMNIPDSVAATVGTASPRGISAEQVGRRSSGPFDIHDRIFPSMKRLPSKYKAARNANRGTFDYFDSPENAETRISYHRQWAYTLIAALLIGLVKGGVSWITKLLWDVRVEGMSIIADDYNNTIFMSMILYAAVAFISGVIASSSAVFLAPASAGGGIPDIKAFLNGNLLQGFLSRRTVLGRLFGICLVTSCGVMAGPEGPMAHVGMIFAYLVPAYIFKQTLTDKQLYDFATVGAGMGISAAFNAPIAGTLFALEEAASYWHPSLLGMTFFGSLVSAVVGTYASAGFTCTPNYPYCIPFGGEFSISVIARSTFGYHPFEVLIFAIVGVWSAIFALLISYGIVYIQRIRGSRLYSSRNWIRIADAGIVFALTAFVFSVVTIESPCQPMIDLAGIKTSISSHICQSPTSEFNPIGFILLEPRSTSISSLFSLPFTNQLPGYALGLSGVIALIFTILTNGVFLPAGLFIPMVMCGSIFGRLFGQWVAMIPNLTVNPGVYAIAGAAGVLSGVSRMSIWIAAVILEASGDIDLAVPVMMTIVISKLISDAIMRHDLYHRIIQGKGIEFLRDIDDSEVFEKISKIRVRDLMTQPAVCFRENEHRFLLEDVLTYSDHSIYPLVDGEGRLMGAVQRRWLEDAMSEVLSPASTINIVTSSYPLSVNENFDALKCYYLFTQLGTKLVVVVDQMNAVIGVVTRQNFISRFVQ